MAKYEVRDVVCDYGLFINDELALICNSRSNALLIKAIMQKDDRCNRDEYTFNLKDAKGLLDLHGIRQEPLYEL